MKLPIKIPATVLTFLVGLVGLAAQQGWISAEVAGLVSSAITLIGGQLLHNLPAPAQVKA